MADEVTIGRLGHRGDGIVSGPGGECFVPGALPGERVVLRGEGARRELSRIVTASPDRAEPFCRHYGQCGGCVIQHLEASRTAEWKKAIVSDALASRGIDAIVDGTWTAPDASRRRAVFSLARFGGRSVLGFHEARSRRILDLSECPILLPVIETRLSALKRLGEVFAPRKGEAAMHVLSAGNGLDVAISPAGTDRLPPDIGERMQAAGAIRLSLDGALALQFEPPTLDMAGIAVAPPPAAFVQASAEAEREMARLAGEWLADCTNVADLFSGMGALSLALARHSPVTAVDSDVLAVGALETALRGARGIKPVRVLRRDLFRVPLQSSELAGFDGVLFDPPRAGAAAQATEIAASTIRRVVAISCNPATMARDIRILLDGGYRLRRIVPLDQFRHAAHVEAVACLER
ncbi:MAG: class I SAM-dependent RNA methyltransferase [Rhodobiaceae bacterium]|nr:class I SAM-dependent RNA methyltransferase [Rhodobiaceae bacterium]MCC0054771.1 class I SAM-dependent RNA methyltransferase [Rhodobiaceae bacterium]